MFTEVRAEICSAAGVKSEGITNQRQKMKEEESVDVSAHYVLCSYISSWQ